MADPSPYAHAGIAQSTRMDPLEIVYESPEDAGVPHGPGPQPTNSWKLLPKTTRTGLSDSTESCKSSNSSGSTNMSGLTLVSDTSATGLLAGKEAAGPETRYRKSRDIQFDTRDEKKRGHDEKNEKNRKDQKDKEDPMKSRRIARVATTISIDPSSWGWSWLRSEAFGLLTVVFPVAIAGGALGWEPKIVFSLCALSLAGLEVLVSTTLERISLLSAFTGKAQMLAAVLLEIIPVIFPTMIGIVAVVQDEMLLAKSFVIGNVLTNILLGTGAALFVGGIQPRQESYAQQIGDTAMELVKLAMIASAPIIMAWAMIYVMTQQTEVSGSDTGTVALSADATKAIDGLSRGTAIVLLLVFLFWVLFRRGTHRHLFADDDRDRHANLTVRSQKRALEKDRKGKGREDDLRNKPRTFWRLPHRAAVLVVPVVLAAAVAASIFCSIYLVKSAVVIVPETPASSSSSDAEPVTSSLRRHFLSSVLLPLLVNLYNYLRAAELASCGGRDVSLSVHLTYGAGASVILLTLPVLVLVGWTTGHVLLLDFAAFDVSLLAFSVWASSILVTSQVDYFRGFVMLCLYIIIALAIFLYKE